MKSVNLTNIRTNSYPISRINVIKNINMDILPNILELHRNCKNEQKSNILALVAFDEHKKFIKKFGFKFTEKQFKAAKNKRINKNLTLNNYKRHVPES